MQTQHEKNVFSVLSSINVNDKTEKKKDLTYLSWTYAWSEVKKRYSDANYEIMFFDGYPYIYDPSTGYMVFTKMTIEGQTHIMWLPVMDPANKSMKSEEYSYETKFGIKTVDKASMFDINKTIMRCLVKNIAMFGLGIYIYSGEDLPEIEQVKIEEVKKAPAKKKVESIEQLNKIVDWVLEDLSRHEKVNQFYDLDKGQFEWLNMEIQNRTM
jgi:hypothetical protein